MGTVRFEKFEMKYGCYLPEDFKNFMGKYGGDAQFGSCRFEYPVNIVNNLLRIPGKMDFHLIPFGDVGNGDYYCFYKYGNSSEEYFVGIWLHETGNFVILSSSFKGFIYKCVLDDYLSTVIPNEEFSDEENMVFAQESYDRCDVISEEFGFDLDKIKKMKNEFDYHKLMAEYDEKSMQSLCYIGSNFIKRRDIRGFDFFNAARKVYPVYTAPYYLLGKAMQSFNKDGKEYFLKGLKTSLVLTGYSYWEEDFLEIPEDVHREMSLLVDEYLGKSEEFFEKSIYEGTDPYDYELRLKMAKEYINKRNYSMAMIEYNNALFCCEDKSALKDILKESLEDAKACGFFYLTGIIEQDLRKFR